MSMEHFEKRIPLMLELGLREEAVSALRQYVELLWKSNEELNLISRKMTFEELIDNHVIDCLLPIKLFPKNAKAAADFGAGGGLPGVLYAIQFPEVSYRLYEKSVLKREFLTRCKAVAPNLKIEGEILPTFKDVDVVTARAFKPLDVILDMSRNYYQSGGSYFLLKGRREKVDEELGLAQKKFKDLKIGVVELKSPLLEVERHLVTIRI
jgi:16S rRNA (guanine527-N7)-methyltransferase